MKSKEDNLIVTKTFDFACDVIDVYSKLIELKMYRLADQV